MSTKIVCVYIIISHLTYLGQCSNMTQGLNTAELLEDEIVFRIERGRVAQHGDVPYQVGFKSRVGRGRYTAFCGGSIIQAKKILTAAHCFVTDTWSTCLQSGIIHRSKLARKMAVAGTLRTISYHKYADTDEEGQWRELTKVIYPKAFKFPKNDIAVVSTLRPFVFNSFVAPIPYARKFKEYNGKCLASGFGRISRNIKSDALLLADLKVIPTRICDRIHRKSMSRFVCTSNRRSDVGKGDSGGPLVCRGTGDPRESKMGILVGVTSGKIVNKRDATFFTRVSSYTSLIQSKSDQTKATSIMFNVCLSVLLHSELSSF